jgi:hypothetical protein
MKITEKIVTSVTQPQQTNVLWHNPETGELKIFGNNGWEVVGGNPGGYPIVTVEDNFNIEAKPNVFYDIKNGEDTEINITFIRKKDVIEEYIFNINSPANIIFNDEIKWNNDNLPDLEQEGIYTISILNGVGCYTFVK